MKTVLYINHKKSQCGVYEFGKDLAGVLKKSTKYNFEYTECNSFKEFKNVLKGIRPQIIIYNCTPITMSWIYSKKRFVPARTFGINAIHIGTIHEVFQKRADQETNEIFDFFIAPDPTLILKNPIVYKTGRLLPSPPKFCEINNTIPRIGSFGFASNSKGFDKLIPLVEKEFDEAEVYLNIPNSDFGDKNGENAKRIAETCKRAVTKKGIRLFINHEYLDRDELISYLSKNSINVFLYDDAEDRGISSAADWALSSGRPLAISKSRMFRHLISINSRICIENNTLKNLIKDNGKQLDAFWKEYTEENILWDYERIISDTLTKKTFVKNKSIVHYYLKSVLSKIGFIKKTSLGKNVWTKDDDVFQFFNHKLLEKNSYLPCNQNINFNTILNNKARKFYEPVIEFFNNHLPELLQKKIPEANVQQAFVFDTTIRLSKNISSPKILGIGAFEDTAVAALKLLQYDIDEIDPVLNYDLETYLTKPSTKPESYDIIVSTSVIEHVENDVKFLMDMEVLLKKGGYIILTCDFKEDYKIGDDIPNVDFRFYTKEDIMDRLLVNLPQLKLVDNPKWDCPNPDFYYGKYNYTFASIVLQKN
jgi:hypothetical protein